MVAELPIPHPDADEEGLISLCLQNRQAFDQVRRVLSSQDFWRPAFALIWETLEGLRDANLELNPSTVMRELGKRNELGRVGGAAGLADLLSSPWANAALALTQAYAVQRASRTRRVIAQLSRAWQVVEEQAEDHEAMLDGLAAQLVAAEAIIEERDGEQPLDGLMSWQELWDLYPDPEPAWIVPGLLVSEDVWMLLGTEGGGKSWISRQFCLALSAGIHPLRPGVRIDPLRTLLVDLENPPALVGYESRAIGSALRLLEAEVDHELARVWTREDGLNLRLRRDQVLFERVVSEHRPDVIALGSLYKAFQRGGDDWDTAAAEVREFLDRIRRRYRCAFVLEHHMPKGNTVDRPRSPYGSSEWLRWPSMGHTLLRVGDNMFRLEPIRGTRMKRDIPVGLYRGGQLPWSPVWDDMEVKHGTWPELLSKEDRRELERLGR